MFEEGILFLQIELNGNKEDRTLALLSIGLRALDQVVGLTVLSSA